MIEPAELHEDLSLAKPPLRSPPRSVRRPVRLVVVARPLLLRQGLELALSAAPGIVVVAAVATGHEALAAIRQFAPQIVAVNLTDPLALQIVHRITREADATKVVGITANTSEDAVVAAVEAGVAALVGPETGVEELISTFAAVERGEHCCSPRVAGIIQRRLQTLTRTRQSAAPEPGRGRERLTARELDVMTLIAEGLSNREIASALDIRLSTVKNHLHNIFEKLDVHDRTQASARLGDDGRRRPAVH